MQEATTTSEHLEDLDRSIAERRSRRDHRQLPKRYRDVLPEAPAALPPASSSIPAADARIDTDASPVIPPHALSPLRKILKSVQNTFGLFRQYRATGFPDHDGYSLSSRDCCGSGQAAMSLVIYKQTAT